MQKNDFIRIVIAKTRTGYIHMSICLYLCTAHHCAWAPQKLVDDVERQGADWEQQSEGGDCRPMLEGENLRTNRTEQNMTEQIGSAREVH